GEADALGLRFGVEAIEVIAAETELHAAGRILFRRGMQRELRFASLELAPERRLETGLEAKGVAVEGNRRVHVADELDRIAEAHRAVPSKNDLLNTAARGQMVSAL